LLVLNPPKSDEQFSLKSWQHSASNFRKQARSMSCTTGELSLESDLKVKLIDEIEKHLW
jgi:hypothetical protein